MHFHRNIRENARPHRLFAILLTGAYATLHAAAHALADFDQDSVRRHQPKIGYLGNGVVRLGVDLAQRRGEHLPSSQRRRRECSLSAMKHHFLAASACICCRYTPLRTRIR
jgi:hypothetical protein